MPEQAGVVQKGYFLDQKQILIKWFHRCIVFNDPLENIS